MNGFLENLRTLQPMPVAILGAGKSGQGVVNLLDRMEWEYEIFDEQERAFEMADARNCSVVITSPGFKPNHSWIIRAIEAGKEILSEVEFGTLFLKKQRVVSITGTNGKTSVTTMLEHVARNSQMKVVAGGNLGIPLTQLVADGLGSETTVFLETSSYQARNLKYFKPTDVVWTNFAPDHLDYHGTKKEYFRSKYRLLELNEFKKCMVGRSVVDEGKKMGFDFPDSVEIIDPLVKENVPLGENHFLLSNPQLENLAFVEKWFLHGGIKRNEFYKLIRNYVGQPFRLQKVESNIEGVNFWNDSKSTNLASTIAACKSFTRKLFWIGGGQSKGEEIKSFARSLRPFIDKAFLVGDTGPELHQIFQDCGSWSTLCKNLKEAVEKAVSFSGRSIDILFSPGFASFDTHENYVERGKAFDRIVLDLKKAREIDTSLFVQSFAIQTGR